MSPASPDDPTLAYYEDQAGAFFAETVGVDMTPLYTRFLARIPPGAHLLDAGCGSGRDALAFERLGYRVSACEASANLAALASPQLRPAGQALLKDRAIVSLRRGRRTYYDF